MEPRTIDEADVFGTLRGRWIRGKARVVDVEWHFDESLSLKTDEIPDDCLPWLESVRTVECRATDTYALEDNARLATRALRQLARDATDEAIVDFVQRYGPLMDLRRWLSRVPTLGPSSWQARWREGFESWAKTQRTLRDVMINVERGRSCVRASEGGTQQAEFDLPLVNAWKQWLSEVEIYKDDVAKAWKALRTTKPQISPALRAEMHEEFNQHKKPEDELVIAEYSDPLMYVRWCGDNGRDADGRYMFMLVARSGCPDLAVLPAHLPTPTSLYVWAAEYLEQIDHDLRAGVDLSDPLLFWIDARLMETHLALSDDPGTLVVHATSLLSYLTAQTILDVHGASPIQRVCRLCGKAFEVKDRRQRYCSEQHANVYRLRRRRGIYKEGKA